MNPDRNIVRDRDVITWLCLVSAIALHVVDETVTGFLPFYNGMVQYLRSTLGFFPAPTFTFEVWLGGLAAGVLVCYGLTVFVVRGGKIIRWFTIIVGVLMVFNALGHLSGSLYFGKILPGTWSSPILLICALLTVVLGIRRGVSLKSESSIGRP